MVFRKLLAKKDRGLKKPSGFHWDLIVVGASAFLCSLFGLQWMCPAAVQSLSHASSLCVMAKTAPGEAPKIDHVLEQRVTAIVVGLLHGKQESCSQRKVATLVSALFLFIFSCCGVLWSIFNINPRISIVRFIFVSRRRWFVGYSILAQNRPAVCATEIFPR